tara:strand:- start:471 stop:902 length:432 start_codon:yes stop_codon:yes gene_type:complete
MKKQILVLLVLGLIFVNVLFYNYLEEGGVCFDKECFEVELAVSESERAKGLMFREHLGEDEGMLFIFPESGVHNFWMKNTLISLDIIWISDDKEVVHIEREVPICMEDVCPSYGSGELSLYVLEINSGKSLGIEVGDSVELDL